MYPPTAIGAPAWTSGLCSGSSISLWCTTCFCPSITFGRIAEIVDQGSTSYQSSAAIHCLINYFTGCAWIYAFNYRTKLRRQFMLPEKPCNDACVHCCCHKCALRQEYRELQNRGFDVSSGMQIYGDNMHPLMTILLPRLASAYGKTKLCSTNANHSPIPNDDDEIILWLCSPAQHPS